MPAKRGITRRLNTIQDVCGYKKSLRGFREALLDPDYWRGQAKAPPSFSYEAMRHYHLDRDPPYSYLAAIVERFDVSPFWLFSEVGPPLLKQVREQQHARVDESGHPLWLPALSAAPDLAQWSPAARALFLETLEDYMLSYAGSECLWSEDGVVNGDAAMELAEDLFGLLFLPYHSLRPDLSRREFTQYVVALIHAVQLRIPEAGAGPHIYTRIPKLNPEDKFHGRERHTVLPDGVEGPIRMFRWGVRNTLP